MGTVQRPNRLILLVILGLSAVLAACSSGGGKGGSSSGNRDTIPDSFTLTTPSGVDPTKVGFGTAVVSAPVKITGINAPAPVSIQGGEFKIESGGFTSTASTISNGQSIQVRVQTPIKAEQTATAILTIGGIEASFTVTTGPDTTPPEVSILFPPPASMTEGQTLFVRGTVKDVHGALEDGAITVNGVEADLVLNDSGDEGEWQVEVELEDGLNAVAVTAVDAKGNSGVGAEIEATKAPITEAFPSDDVPLKDPIGVVLSNEHDHPMIFITDPTAKSVISIDLMDGSRKVLSDNAIQTDDPFDFPWRLAKGEGSTLYVSDRDKGSIFVVDTQTGIRTALSLQDPLNKIKEPKGIAYSPVDGQLYVPQDHSVFSIDTETGDVSIVVDYSSTPLAERPFLSIVDLTVDTKKNRILALDNATYVSINLTSNDDETFSLNERIYAVSIAIDQEANRIYIVEAIKSRVAYLDGDLNQSSSFSTFGGDSSENRLVEPWGISVAPGFGFAVVADRKLKGLVAIDIESGRRVIISKSATQ